ncbi:MAG: hypothetical protein K6T83_03150 [Alicyclobacillus sp.]|nr:hypothetical protein [Alicyclobacillus sp.]
MPSQYQEPDYKQKFSTTYPANINELQMDIPLPEGSVNDSKLFGAKGTGTTSATVGTTTAIQHNLGVVPDLADITITPTSNGVVYIDTANPPTATTFNVLGSAASLNFAWKIITNGPAS